jgi:ionotropic glutamate receptor
LHPTPESLARVFIDLINAWNWQSFTILYEDAPWLAVADHLLRNCSGRMSVAVRQLDVTLNKNYRPRLLQVKQSEEKNIVLCCSIESLEEILKQSLQVGLLSDEHNVLITSPDMHTIDLEPYQYGGTNITAVRMISDNTETLSLVKEIYQMAQADSYKYKDITDEEVAEKANDMRLSTALTYDAGEKMKI